jgi:hypothetical protein
MPPDERPLPLGYGRDPEPNEKNKLRLFYFPLSVSLTPPMAF